MSSYRVIDGVIRYFADTDAADRAEVEAKSAKTPKQAKRKVVKK